ncbi:biotin--protein ligase-like [Haliotis cracherodii]|uniref:biotin--protein ligase-like n=1 Tax=Haliotis cracherodii TaxID=6455 RepID=UPI0039EAF54E
MFLALGYISLVQWYRRCRRREVLMSAVRHVVRNSSIVVSRIETVSSMQGHYSEFVKPKSPRVRTKLHDDDTILLSSITPKNTVNLSTWSRFGETSDSQPHELHVLLEGNISTEFPDLGHHWILKLCQPIAWTRGARIGILVGCSVDDFIDMCTILGEESPKEGEGLDLLSMQTVMTENGPGGDSGISLPDPVDIQRSHLKSDQSNPTDSPANIQETSKPELTNEVKSEKALSPKPPNILIYCGKHDSVRHFQTVSEVITDCVNTDSYTVYHLKHDQVTTTPWLDNTVLLVIATERLYDGTNDIFLDYYNNGGQVMSFGSMFETKFLEREEFQPRASLSVFSMSEKWKDVKCIRGRYNYKGDVGVTSGVCVDVLARDNQQGKPVMMGISGRGTVAGKAVLSQLHLEKDPSEAAMDPDTFDQLKYDNSSRIEILKYLLTWLGLDCSQQRIPPLTPASLLTNSPKTKELFLSSLENRLKGRCLTSRSVNLEFIATDVQNLTVSSSHLPVLTSGPHKHKYFNEEAYWKNLKTSCLGQTVLYADVIPTTMTLFEGLQFSVSESIGVVAIAGRQTSGKGRGGNAWLSPEGCAMFSLHVRVPTNSQLGQRVTFLQHITALAVVSSITSMAGYEDLDLKLKWPNDIYYSNKMKLGGVIVTSTIMGSTIHAIIGCGFNVTNRNPTICINDIVQQYNAVHGTDLPPCSTDQLIARTVTHIERLVSDFQTHGHRQFCERYYKSWLHSGVRVTVESEGGKEMTITGMDDFGYLEVVTDSGRRLSVQPDGNTFDMMRNLISIKPR